MHTKILQWDYRSILIMGDWNGVIDSKLDKKSLVKSKIRLPQTFFEMKEDLELKDVWRIHNLKDLDYTFFSDRHRSFSRIDFILVSNDLLVKTKRTKIFPRTLSDHSPVWIEIETAKIERRSWRLNENLFRYEKNIIELKKQMKEFFDINLNKGTPIEIVWDASKAYMRGVLIHMNSKYKLNRQKKRAEIEVEIKKKEQLLIKNPTVERTHSAIKLLKDQFQMLMADQVATNLQYAKHNTFCNANKPGRWLAYTLRKKQSMRTIDCIDIGGTEIYQQKLIKEVFVDYYTKLYAKEDIQNGLIEKYLENKRITKVTNQQKERLNHPITAEEIIAAIKQLKTAKVPGTDGLTAVYYKTLQAEMVEQLRDLFCNIQRGGKIPPSWKTAYISLIPKEQAGPKKPENYRPISLLNNDYKIYAKVLANRLMPVIKEVIHDDQAGFIEGRYMKDNERQVIDLLEYLEKNKQIPAVLAFLDAEKAFDRVDWNFLLKTLEKMDFGDQFILAVSAIYQEQKAQIIINGSLTTDFKIEKGTRQGCPLSPLLFILTLEVLLNTIRDSTSLKGIVIRQEDYRIRAFADDLVVTLTQPVESIILMKDIIKDYGIVSGFRLNQKKTKLIVKNMTQD
ncbi:transmembrane protein 168 isoform X2 [Pantherophis guttatus]|uniref:Transmembrane protein 168 isoform X2 n=1 Tax=Pantherophis guttatus TaxID=94885 RepID=A0ABM3Z3Z3_PANGU|nr:transmembrane protein 168 isoform X2 [Pantherophis guttatus]XP_060543090.1 transmembrane protein 168 isoform X2 [Pantherophis guttatus]